MILRIRLIAAAGWIASALICASSTGLGQHASGASIARVTGGAVLGGAVGMVVGGFAGAAFTSRNCESGNPDACLGESFPGFLWGAGVGGTIAIPLGAHYAGGRRDALVPSMLVSAAIFGAEVLALRSAVKDGQYVHKRTAIAVVIAAPILQIISSVAFEARANKN